MQIYHERFPWWKVTVQFYVYKSCSSSHSVTIVILMISLLLIFELFQKFRIQYAYYPGGVYVNKI